MSLFVLDTDILTLFEMGHPAVTEHKSPAVGLLLAGRLDVRGLASGRRRLVTRRLLCQRLLLRIGALRLLVDRPVCRWLPITGWRRGRLLRHRLLGWVLLRHRLLAETRRRGDVVAG